LELRQLGGALAEPPGDAGALSALTDEFALFGVGIVMGPEMGQAIGAHIERVTERMAPWSGGAYLNFCERKGGGAARAFDAASLARLRDVKARYDAGNLFRSNHPLEPALRRAAT
jgi:Berberine and berberine like